MLVAPCVVISQSKQVPHCCRFVAKRYGQSSVLGSYLDPLAAKALIGCGVAALVYEVGPSAPALHFYIQFDIVCKQGPHRLCCGCSRLSGQLVRIVCCTCRRWL